MKSLLPSSATVVAFAGVAAALDLVTDDAESIRNATSTVAYNMMSYYTGNVTDTPSTIAVLPQPYYWWEAGAMWGAMVDYWWLTNDTTYNDVVSQALVSQVGPNNDFMMPNQQYDEGNDDQSFWGFAALSAAEKGFPAPPSGTPSWIKLTENLWNTQVRRWNTASCGGGLKWQIFSSNAGYDYKNSISNGAFFNIASRLARYTGNSTYSEWADKSWDWVSGVGLLDAGYHVYDGTDDTQNCTSINHIAWTYNQGVLLHGAAVMYNVTDGAESWRQRVAGLLQTAEASFFSPYDNATDVLFEAACEEAGTCDTDNYSFKAYIARFMWAATHMAPFTAPTVTRLLSASAAAAAAACSGGDDGVSCGTKWYTGGFDAPTGVGQQMSALEAMQGLLINGTTPLLTSADAQLVEPEPSSVSSSTGATISSSSSSSSSSASSSSSPSSSSSSTSSTTTTTADAATVTVTSMACLNKGSVAAAVGGAVAALGVM